MSKKKHGEFILAVERKYFDNNPLFKDGVTEYMMSNWLNEVQSHLVIKERAALEIDSSYLQIIPYAVIRQADYSDGKRYHAYRRTSLSGEKRLAGNVSIGYGGHIDMLDIATSINSVIDLKQTIINAVKRELEEEITVTFPFGYDRLKEDIFSFSNMFIMDSSNEVGKVHLGIVLTIDLPEASDIACNEIMMEAMPPLLPGQLLKSDYPLESWSSIYLKHKYSAVV